MKEKKAKKNQTTVRMNLLFVSVFFLFSMLILRLGVVQIVKGSQYEAEVSRTENVKSDNGNPPRGKIYDRYRNVIVDNVPMNAITYTSTQSTKSKEMLEVAENLSKLIDIDEKVIESINPRDKQDYWLLRNKEKAAELVTKDELAKLEADEGMNEEERNKKVYEMQLDRIPKDELKAISKQELKVLAIFRQFNTGYALTPKIVKNKNVSDEEMARVSENLSSLPGVNVTTDWERKYVQDSTLRSILGKVSTTEQGIPTELVDDFKSKGYAMNDRVGTSYFESEYESLLKGKKEEIEHITKNGSVIDSQMIKEGHSGKDVYLTIDLKLQKELEKIVEEELSKQAAKRWESPYLDRAYLIMMNPYTGEILSMVGKKYGHDKDGNVELQDDALGTFTSEYGVGSAVKGATVLTGYMTDSLAIGEPLLDEAIQIKDTPVKRSWFNQSRGAMYMTDKQALEWSSNAYMWKTAFKVAGVTYQKDQPMNIKRETFDTFRNHFKQFGLGVKTEIDLPGEADGLQGSEYKPGNLMDFAIGQYDTYTPMQLAQYVSTIANGGYRMQPHIMKEIREPNYESEKVGSLLYEHESKVLNRLDASEEEIHSVQQGFYRVAHGANGTANNFANAPYDAAAKSGTAEAFYYAPERGKNLETYNTTLVGYAPYSHPEVSFAVVLPASHQDKDPYVNKTIAKRAMDKYFELKKEYEKKGYYSESTDKEVIETEE